MHEFARMSLGVMGQSIDDTVAPGERPSELEVMMHVAQTPPGHVAYIAPNNSSKYGMRTRCYGQCILKHYNNYRDTTSLVVLGYVDVATLGPHLDCTWCSMPLAGHLA